MSDDRPISNGGSNGGRNGRGRFTKGNPGGPGNPNAADVGRHRANFFAAIRDEDLQKALQVIRDVMESGKDSDKLAAARELLDRVLGKSIQSDLQERIEAIEKALAQRAAQANVNHNGSTHNDD